MRLLNQHHSFILFPFKYAEPLLKKEDYIDHDLYGVVRLQQCQVPVKISKLNVLLIDELGNEIELENVLVALSELEGIPALIGMKDILENCSIFKLDNDKIELKF